MHGWLILDKPTGMSSAHAVAKVKHILKPSKIGHAGTLDPLASGILPLALGEATKTVPYMMDTDKTYAFTVAWGERRDTDDREGKVVATSPKRPSKEQIEAILCQFMGAIEQIPPQFSALKAGGERAYDLARAGKVADLKSRKVLIHSIEITNYHAENTDFICKCGKGTYIRSMARDMGEVLGCHGHVSALRRLSVGKFTEKDAISLEVLPEIVHKGGLGLLPVEAALDDILAFEVTTDQAMRLMRGQSFPVELVSDETVLARHDGKAVALCNVSQGQMKPVRVFNIQD